MYKSPLPKQRIRASTRSWLNWHLSRDGGSQGSGVQGHSQLCSELEARMSMRPCLKTEQSKIFCMCEIRMAWLWKELLGKKKRGPPLPTEGMCYNQAQLHLNWHSFKEHWNTSSSKGLECQSWLKSAPISRRGRRNVPNSSWPNTLEGGAVAKPLMFTRKKECWFCRFLIMFSQPVLFPIHFKKQCFFPHLLYCHSSIILGPQKPFLPADHTSVQPKEQEARISAVAMQNKKKKIILRCGTPELRTLILRC